MGMDPVGPALLSAKAGGDRIRQVIEMGPELLLAQIATRPERQAHDRRTIPEGLMGHGVVGREALVVDQTGDHLHLIHLRAGRQAADQLQHIGGLPTGIRIAPKFKIVSTEQPVQVQMQQRQTQRTPRRSSPA